MKQIGLGILAAGMLAGCGVGPTFEDTRPLRNTSDLISQTVAGATCTRGEKPFTLIIDKDGSATGRLIAPKPPKGQKRQIMPEFPAMLKAVDRKTVELIVGPDIVTQGAVAEKMSAVLKGGQAILRGESFDCYDVRVRTVGA